MLKYLLGSVGELAILYSTGYILSFRVSVQSVHSRDSGLFGQESPLHPPLESCSRMSQMACTFIRVCPKDLGPSSHCTLMYAGQNLTVHEYT